MPDPNKLQTLRDIGYTVKPCCGICKHGQMRGGGWGYCDIQQYQHEKHVGLPRQLSVFTTGWCPKFEIDQHMKDTLEASGFTEFMEKSP